MDFKSKLPKDVYPGHLICPIYHGVEENGTEFVYQFIPGPGTVQQQYTINGQQIDAIAATLLGKVKLREETNALDGSESAKPDAEADPKAENTTEASQGRRVVKKMLVSVSKRASEEDLGSSVDTDFANHLPKEGDVVLTRVTRITLQRANVEILAVENTNSPIDYGVGSKGSGIVASNGGNTGFSMSQVPSDLGETFRGIIRSQDVRATNRDQVKMVEAFRPGDIVRAQVLSLGDGSNYYLTTARNDLGVVFAKASNGAGGLMYAVDWHTMVAPSTGVTELRKCAKPF
ncbi:ABL199Wp [Eremothecium gossypii ATCC 10895]|uniref:ABL199Wp n=1 Tax=Eremothecium gossypii (strain ATCC 10895 / CBS 109.51 / FGSC 9923 / NRRL Y-1056) TaxID=284811 RepID=Q75E69_EREGS|nr:ABL199Wp [Eremothecium gossypii ATCC 10895]AAS50572.1 ABL199Wp [Eremothecium gossypii ATCC 10895]AEY94860.1 FABL199Wp [Eremothecium gossypii FDAG1]